jgi:hypothetical protein
VASELGLRKRLQVSHQGIYVFHRGPAAATRDGTA